MIKSINSNKSSSPIMNKRKKLNTNKNKMSHLGPEKASLSIHQKINKTSSKDLKPPLDIGLGHRKIKDMGIVILSISRYLSSPKLCHSSKIYSCVFYAKG